MVKLFLFACSLICCTTAISQTKKTKGIMGISVPLIWNNSEATYYQLGSPKYPSGYGISYGFNLNYSQPFYRGFYGIIGIGYFKQAFGIERPLDYVQPDGTKPLVYTKSYLYENLNLLAGVGYVKRIDKNWAINSKLIYNWFSNC